LLDAGIRITGAAHVTGGGIANKLGRVLRATGLGARIDAPLAPSPAMLELQRMGEVDDEAAYRAWNMGQGFLLITDRDDVDRVIAGAASRGIGAAPVGHVTKEPTISVRSRGLHGGDLAWPTPRFAVAPPTPHDPPTLPSSENRT
jgi:phosphoribosylformylglycinamidine cyclo-ligase